MTAAGGLVHGHSVRIAAGDLAPVVHESADVDAGLGARGRLEGYTGILKCLVGAFEEKALFRVEGGGLGACEVEEGSIEAGEVLGQEEAALNVVLCASGQDIRAILIKKTYRPVS